MSKRKEYIENEQKRIFNIEKKGKMSQRKKRNE